MYLSKLLVKWLEWIIEIAIYLTLIGAFMAGVKAGNGFFGSIISAILFTLVSAVVCALFFGIVIAILDIREMLKKLTADRERVASSTS